MKRGPNQRLAEAIGIRLIKRTPGLWGAAVLIHPGTAYSFRFPSLVLRRRGGAEVCRPGVHFVGSSFGIRHDQTEEDAWRRAIDEFRRAIAPKLEPAR